MNTRPIRVLIADDHGIMRDGLRTLMESQKDLLVVGEVDSAPAVLEAVGRTSPTVVLLDISMPGGGLSALDALKASPECPRVLVLTMHDRTAYVRQALNAGADGYVVKSAAGSVLIDAIRTVAGGERYVHASLPEGGLDEVLANPEPTDVDAEATPLSPREREVLQFVANGYTNREAADKLGLSVKTVEGYRARLARKVGAKSRVDLVRFAMEQGLLDAEDD